MEYQWIISDIAGLIDKPFDTVYKGGNMIDTREVESLIILLPGEELILPFQKNTVHTLLSQLFGTLQMGESDAFSILNDDKIHFNKDYWEKMLKAYQHADRSYLGKENALFFILRTTLQGLAQIRLLRTNITPKFVVFEEKLDNIHATLNNQVHTDRLLALVNQVHTKLDNAEDFRIRASEKMWQDMIQL